MNTQAHQPLLVESNLLFAAGLGGFELPDEAAVDAVADAGERACA